MGRMAAVLGALLVALVGAEVWAAAPPLPARFYGAVQYGGADAPAGTEITAWINGIQYGRGVVIGTGSVYVLDVSGDSLDTAQLEGGRDGDEVVFLVDGYPADQTATWSAGGYTQLDLTATPPPTAPVAQDQALTTNEDTPLAITLQATDINGDALTYTVITSPTHGTLTGTAPDLLYTPVLDYNGPDSFTFTASDGTGTSNTATVSVDITPVADAPRLAAIADSIVTAGQVLDVPLSAVDPEGDAITLNTIGRPAFANLVDNGDGSGSLVLTPGLGDVGVYPGVEIVTEDTGGLKGRTTIVIRVQANQAPDLVLRSFALSNPNPSRGVTIDMTVDLCNDGAGAATDVPVRFSVGPPDTGMLIGEQTVASLPGNGCQTVTQSLNTAGLQLSQILYATADPANTIAELDDSNNQAVVALNLSGAIDNVPPEIRSIPVASAQVGATYRYDVNAVDLDGDMLTYALTVAPQGMSIDARIGLITWPPQAYDLGPRTVEVSVDDGWDGVTTQRFIVDVTPDNFPPQITSTPVLDAFPDAQYIYDVDATDPEGAAVAFYLQESPMGMVVEQTTGIIRWTPTPNQVGLHNVIVEAVDAGGASARQGFGVRVLGDGVGPDLVVVRVDNAPAAFDTQALTLSGAVDVTVGNAGNQDVTGPFDLLLFDDVDGDSLYTAGVDAILGQTTLNDGLVAGATAVATVSVSGLQDFRDDLIFAWVDSSEQVAESDEGNNQGSSGQASQFHPRPGPFTPELLWSWTGSDVEPEYDDVMMTPLVVNLTDDNGDGVIDQEDVADIVFVTAVATTVRAGILRAISGADGTLLWSVTDPLLRAMPYHTIAAGDVDGDGLVEIIVNNGNAFRDAPPSPIYGNRLMIFEHDGTFKGAGDLTYSGDTILLADLEGDGAAEIIIGNRVFNGDGTLRWQGSMPYTGSGYNYSPSFRTPASPAAADLDMDGDLELITGIVAYHADGTIFYDVSDNPDLFNAYISLGSGGNTAVGNFDQDPNPEVVIVAANVVTLLDTDGAVLWQTGTSAVGPPTVADMDGDGLPEIGVASGPFYTVLDTDGTVLWQSEVAENGGFTGSTVFDFEGDGAAEIVYNDVHYLRVYRGSDGAVLFQVPNPTGTYNEEPVVADVNNDGHAEIIVGRNQFGFNGAWVETDSGIFVYGDKWRNWGGTRRIWNQHAYHITNVNEDGTIPAVQTPNWTYFNNYRANQMVPEESAVGPFAAPDLTASLVAVDQASCPVSATVSARIGNGGDDVAPAGVQVSFYDGDPDAGAPLIGTTTTSGAILPGQYEEVSVEFAAPAADYHRITVRADDAGSPVFVASRDLVRLPGTRISDHSNVSNVERVIDGNVRSMAVGGPGNSFFEIAFARPVDIDSLIIQVDLAPGITYYPACAWPVTATLTFSNGFSTPLTVTCNSGTGPMPAPPFYTPPIPTQEGITSARLDFTVAPGASGVEVGELFFAGGYKDARTGVIAEGREDNNQAAASFALCGGVAPDNATPQILSTPPAGAVQGIRYEYDVVAVDLDGDSLSYALVNGPAGMALAPDSGQLRWTPQSYQSGDFSVALQVSDGRGGQASQSYTVTVGLVNEPPVFTSTPVTSATVGDVYAYAATADDPEGAPLSFTLLAAPVGMRVDGVTGQITWAPRADQVGSHAVTVQVRDTGGQTDQQSFAVVVTAAISGQDLLISAMDNRSTTTDLNSLNVGGAVRVTFGNAGDTAVTGAFEVRLFADADGDGQYTPGVDTDLGASTYTAGLAAGEFVDVDIAVNGTVDFRDDHIFGYIDSADAIAEVDETNNVSYTGRFSIKQVADNPYWVETEQIVPIPNPYLQHAPLVANLTDDNGDGRIDELDVPEIIFLDNWSDLQAWDTQQGTLLWKRDRGAPYDFVEGIPAVGDIDGDGVPEIILVHVNGDRILIFNADGTPRTVGEIWFTEGALGPIGGDIGRRIGGRSAVSLANIDRQGDAEILLGNVILNSDGSLRCQGTGAIGGTAGGNAMSTAVDLDLAGDMELVAGNTAYRSDCSILWQNTALPDGWVSVGNLDADPNPEIVLIGTDNRIWVLEHDGAIKSGPITAPGGTARGLATIADFDGDGMAEIGVVGQQATVFEADLSQNWSLCCNFGHGAAFDFEGDGVAELIFTTINVVEGSALVVHDGATGAKEFSYPIRPQANGWVYPVVADVDTDANAEMLIPTDQGIMVLGSRLGGWANTRPIWNQQTYHDTNVNDDGSIPLVEAPYTSEQNRFKQNLASLLAPDVTASRLTVSGQSCPASVTVSARIGNGGSAVLPAGTAVTLYDTFDGQIEQPVGSTTTSRALAPGEYEDVTITFDSPQPGTHGLAVVADLDLTFDDLNWLPGVLASSGPSLNGQPASRLLDSNLYTDWCSTFVAPTQIDFTYPYPVNISSVNLSPSGSDPDKRFTTGTLEFSNGFAVPVIFDANGAAAVSFPTQEGVTSLRFISDQRQCLGEISVGGSLSNVPTIDGPISRIDQAMVQHWPLDDSATNVISPTNSGTLVGNPQFVAGLVSPGLNLDGVDDHVRVDDFAWPAGGFSVAMWLRTDDTTRQGTILSYATSGSADEVLLRNYGDLQFCRAFGCTLASGVAVNDGGWHHVVMTVDANRVRLFIDGELRFDPNGYGATPVAGGTLIFGQDQDYEGGGFQNSEAFAGSMDDVKVFDRVLTPDEVALEYGLRQSSRWRYGEVVNEGSEDNNRVERAVELCTTVNTPPTFVSTPVVSAQVDNPYVYDVQAADVDNDTLSYTLLQSPAGMSFVAGTSRIEWTPSSAQVGNYAVSVQVSDSLGGVAVQNFTVVVSPQPPPPNQAPVCADTSLVLNEDTSATQTLICTDPDAGDTVTIELVDSPVNGTVTLAFGRAAYTPAPDYFGADSFTFRAVDSQGEPSTTATATITVEPVNDPPVAANGAVTTTAPSPIDITFSAQDVEGQPLNYELIIESYNGTVTGSGADWVYTPQSGYAGPDVVTFRVNDGGAISNIGVVDITVLPEPVPVLTITKTNGVDSVVPGEILTYTIGLTNTGAAAASGVTVTDTLPAESTLLHASSGGLHEGNIVTWTIVTLDVDASNTMTVSVQLASAVAAGVDTIANTVEATDAQGRSAVATDIDSLIAQPVLAIAVDDGQLSVVPGDVLTYTITISNTGTRAASNVVLSATLPANSSLLDAGSGSVDVDTVIWDLGEVQAGALVPLTLSIQLDASVPAGFEELSFAAVVGDESGTTVSVEDVNQVDAAPLLELTKENGLEVIEPGSIITYTITLSNTGNQVAADLTLTDTLPAESQFIQAGQDGVSVGNVVTWTVDTLQTGAQITRTVSVQVTDTVPSGATSLTNTVQVVDGSGVEATATDVDQFGRAQLALSKTNGVDLVEAGSLLTYTISITNDGTLDATGLVLTDTLPAYVSFFSADDGGIESNGVVTWSIGTLARSAQITRSLSVRVDSTLPADVNLLTNVAEVAADGLLPISASDTDTLNATPVLVLEKSDGVTTATAGTVLTYTLTLTNVGTQDAIGLVLTDTLPGNSTLLNADQGGVESSGVVTWSIDILEAGTSLTRTLAVRVDDLLSPGVDTVLNQATVSAANQGAQADPREKPEALDVTDLLFPPTATDDAATTDEDTAVVLDVLSNDVDANGDVLSINGFSAPADGTVTIKGTLLVYTPTLDFNGSDSFTYVVSDGVLTDTATVTIDVTPVNDAPLAVDDTAGTDEDTSVTIDVLSNDVDVDGDDLTILSVGTPVGGTAIISGTDLVYTPTVDFIGPDSVSYVVSDGVLTDTATVNIMVAAVNDAPQANSQTTSTDEDIPLSITLTGSDVDGDELTYTLVTSPTHGMLSGVAPDLTYTPDVDYNGTDSFDFVVSDGQIESNLATVSTSITPVNDPPQAVEDSVTTDEDTSLTIAVLSNDSDVDGDPLSVVSVSTSVSSTVTISGTELIYTPDPDVNGNDSFSYVVSDGVLTDTAQVVVTVNPVNDAPVMENQSFQVDENSSIGSPVGTLLASDVEGDALSYTILSSNDDGALALGAASGSLTVLDDTRLNFEINPEITLIVEVRDENGLSDSATVIVSVNDVNESPDFTSTPITVATEHVVYSYSVLAQDEDIGDALTIIAVTAPSWLTLVDNSDGTAVLSGTPGNDDAGAHTVELRVEDGAGLSATQAFTIDVASVNDAPTALDDDATTQEDVSTTIAVLVNDTDPDNDPLVVDTVGSATNGTVAINGTVNVVYTPTLNFYGTDTFTYTVSDNKGGRSVATVTVTVTAVNDTPVADDQAVTTDEDSALAVTLTGSDVDGDSLSYTLVNLPADGELSGAAPNLTYTPNADFSGEDSFTFVVSDGLVDSAEATVSITVSPVNDAPNAVDDTATTPEDTSVTIDVLANDSDIDGDILTVLEVGLPSAGTTAISSNRITYVPASDVYGIDTFTYTLSDGTSTATAVVTVDVLPVNDTPRVEDQSFQIDENASVGAIVGSVQADDADNDALRYIMLSGNESGAFALDDSVGVLSVLDAVPFDFETISQFSLIIEVTDGGGLADSATVTVLVNDVNEAPFFTSEPVIAATEGVAYSYLLLAQEQDAADSLALTPEILPDWLELVDNGDGTALLSGTPTYADAGDYDVTIRAEDTAGNFAVQAFTITVANVNLPPEAQDDTATTDEDTPVVIDVLINDIDVDGDSLTVTAVGTPLEGALTTNGATLTYTPTLDFYGSETFTYTISDGLGGTDTATVTVAVVPVNDAPLAEEDAYSTEENSVLTVSDPGVLSNDQDVDNDPLTAVLVGGPGHGTLFLDTTGSFIYTPPVGYSGTDSFTYIASDGFVTSEVTTVTVTVFPVNDVPTAEDQAVFLNEDASVSIVLTGTDPDGDVLDFAVEIQPSNGTLSGTAPDLTYTPVVNYYGSDSFTFRVSDSQFDSVPATVSITIVPVNDAPSVQNDHADTDEDSPVVIDVLANDTDVDGDTLSIIAVTQGTNGSVEITGQAVRYVPTPDFCGEDSFTYTIDDGVGGEAVATVTVEVTCLNDAPTAVNDEIATNEDTAVLIDVLANDSDVDGDIVTLATVIQPVSGTVSIVGANIVYTPALNYYGTTGFAYTVSDSVLTSTATVAVTIVAVNDAPFAIDDEVTTPMDTAVTVEVLANDSDVENDTLSVIAIGQPVSGTATRNTDDTVTYVPNAGFFGIDSFTYTVADGNSGISTATVVVAVELPPVVYCDLYPIALHQTAVESIQPGDALTDILNGAQPGNFGWLTWSGNPNVPTLVANLTPPGNSDTYVNPNVPGDHLLTRGDWVQGRPGVSNSKQVRDALDNLLGQEIVVPVWDEAAGAGNNSSYRVSSFARVRITDYRLPGQNSISAEYVASEICGDTDVYRSSSGMNDSTPNEIDSPFSIFLPALGNGLNAGETVTEP